MPGWLVHQLGCKGARSGKVSPWNQATGFWAEIELVEILDLSENGLTPNSNGVEIALPIKVAISQEQIFNT